MTRSNRKSLLPLCLVLGATFAAMSWLRTPADDLPGKGPAVATADTNAPAIGDVELASASVANPPLTTARGEVVTTAPPPLRRVTNANDILPGIARPPEASLQVQSIDRSRIPEAAYMRLMSNLHQAQENNRTRGLVPGVRPALHTDGTNGLQRPPAGRNTIQATADPGEATNGAQRAKERAAAASQRQD